MRIYPECIPCILSVRIKEMINAGRRDSRLALQLMEYFAEILRKGVDEGTIASSMLYNWLIEKVPEVVKYYKKLKLDMINRAMDSLPVYEGLLDGLEGYDEFRMAVKIAALGNLFDTGVMGHESPANLGVEDILQARISLDQTKKLYGLVKKGGLKIVYLLDNASEAVLDTLLMDLLRRYGNHVVAVAKEEPGFQNDLTIDDAIYAGVDRAADELISTGTNSSSIFLDKISRELLEKLEESDLVIAKGMAHFEYMSLVQDKLPVGTIFYILVPKCQPVARAAGGEKGTIVVRMARGGRR
ncbi:MAG: DUF89 family protein [Crenarchaeota archaeon]|nr:DUF89 family protein [Thermoproteota archaeon]